MADVEGLAVGPEDDPGDVAVAQDLFAVGAGEECGEVGRIVREGSDGEPAHDLVAADREGEVGSFAAVEAEGFVVEEEFGDAHDGVGASFRGGAGVGVGGHVERGVDGVVEGCAAFGVEVGVEGPAAADFGEV
ncbi:MAG TPA: hypothetical protein VGI86_04595 [Acidimicrobiia bacterium]